MTYRERRLAKADRLRGWADKRTSDAQATLASDPELRSDWAFITQPGRIPYRDRMNKRDDAAMRSLNKADDMSRRADGIERAAENAIYSDDPDAVERLQEKIAGLEAKRAAMKDANAAYRKNHRSELAAMTAYERSTSVPFATYELSNLGGNIGRLRERLADLERRAVRTQAAEAAGGVTVAQSGGYARVTFAEKPDREVINELKTAGFYWGAGSWTGPADKLPAQYREENA